MAAAGFAGSAAGTAGGRAGGRPGAPTAGRSIRARGRVGLPNTITIRSLTDRVEYRFAVSGTVEFGPESGENDEIVDGSEVLGLIEGKGVDDYRFSGHLTAFEILEGDATVTVDGERIDDGAGGTDEPEPDRGKEQCVEIEPLRFEGRTVTEFYGYTPDLDAPDPRQSNTPTDLERAGVSRLFLFEGPDGLSLVVIHGGGEGEEGGAASFEVGGLPPDGEWVVLDDSHEGTNDVFEIAETSAALHWAWGAGGRNDGAAFRGLGDEFEVRIEPAFNEAARRDPLGPGRVTAMQVLSGSAEDPDVFPVPLDRPVVFATGGC